MNVNLKFITNKMWHPTEPMIEEEEEGELFSFPHMVEVLDNVHKSPIYAELKPLKNCLKTVNTDSESEGCSLASTICSIFTFQIQFLIRFTLDILNMYMNQRVFSLTGLFLLRETSFQQVTPVLIRP